MINKKILAGILAASLATVPLITTYASMPDIEDVSYASDDEKEEEAPKVDKAANFQNSVNLTDEVAKGDETSNVMFSPTSLNFALGMIAEGAKGGTKKVLSDYLGTDNFSEIVKANVINVSGTKNGMLEVKYRYYYDGEKYEKNVRQSVDEIKAGDKKEIRIRKSIPEKIITTTMTTAICNIISFTLCFIASLGVLLAVVWLDEEKRKGKF